MLQPIQAFRWFIDYGGRRGSLWENRVIRVIPPTPVPFNAYLAAPYIRAPTLVMVGRNDEMVHCNPDVTRATYDLMRCQKQWTEIDGGQRAFRASQYAAEFVPGRRVMRLKLGQIYPPTDTLAIG